MIEKRVSAKKKARELAKYLRAERPDYAYLKRLFQHLRNELEIEVPTMLVLPHLALIHIILYLLFYHHLKITFPKKYSATDTKKGDFLFSYHFVNHPSRDP